MTTTPTERRLAITPGEATIRHDYNVFAGDRLVCNAGGHQNNHDNGKGDAENRANATLYADAHNTYNACGLTPSELLAKVTKLRSERDELVGALRVFADMFDGDLDSIGGGTIVQWRTAVQPFKDAKAILSKHKPE